MLPECKILFDTTKESLKRIEKTNEEEFKEVKVLLNNHGDCVSKLREDVAFIKGKFEGKNTEKLKVNNPGNTSSITIKWKNLSGFSRFVLKVVTTIVSLLLIYGGYTIAG